MPEPAQNANRCSLPTPTGATSTTWPVDSVIRTFATPGAADPQLTPELPLSRFPSTPVCASRATGTHSSWLVEVVTQVPQGPSAAVAFQCCPAVRPAPMTAEPRGGADWPCFCQRPNSGGVPVRAN